MEKKISEKSISVLLLIILFVVPITITMNTTITTVKANEVDPNDIESAIELGIEWLIQQQNEDGSWSKLGAPDFWKPATTGFVLIKLQDRAYELGLDPFETNPLASDYYEYATNVINAWEYLFSSEVCWKHEVVPPYDMVGDPNPDVNGNGYGISFGGAVVYDSGVCLMALAASRAPDRENDGYRDFNLDGEYDTFQEVAQEVVEWLAFAQREEREEEGEIIDWLGSWGYTAHEYYLIPGSELDPTQDRGDNSNSGYAVLGLAAAERFDCTVPQFVKDKLSAWIDTIQNDPGPDDNFVYDIDPDGGSGYYPLNYMGSDKIFWVNQLKTANLIFEMTLCGDTPTDTRFQNALDYIERHWHDTNLQPGWGYGQSAPAHYQAMYCLMKGLEYCGIDLLDLDQDSVPEHDWYQEFANILINQQQSDGHWLNSPCYVYYYPPNPWGTHSGEVLSTVWALLVLEKIAPILVLPIYVDIKPGSWPNPINPKSKGVIPVAICGTEEFDVTTIDPTTIQITTEELEEGVSALRWSYEDVATPYTGEEGGGHELNGDGYIDLVLHFDTQEVVNTLKLTYYIEETIPLIIKGNLKEEYGETPISGKDFVKILGKALKPFVIDDTGEGDYTWKKASKEWWCQGKGTEEDPYIIKNIAINGEGSTECLVIRNSNAYFIVEQCKFYNCEIIEGVASAALVVENAANGKIINNDCSNNANTGIGVRNSNGIEVLENTCMENIYGIVVAGWGMEADNNLIEKNVCTKNSHTGIILWNEVEYNIVNENFCSENLYGITLSTNADNNFVIGNICLENELGILFSDGSDENDIVGNTIENNNVGVYFHWVDGLDNSTNNYIDYNNLLYNNYAWAGSPGWPVNYWYYNNIFGPNNYIEP